MLQFWFQKPGGFQIEQATGGLSTLTMSGRMAVEMRIYSRKLVWQVFQFLTIPVLMGGLLAVPASGRPPQSVESLFQQAQAFEQDRNYTAAENIYQKVLASDPRNPEALKRLGIVQQTQLKFDDSIESFKRALSVHPDFPQVNFFLGLSYYGRRDINSAISIFDQELKTPSPHPGTRYYLSLALQAAGRVNEALIQLTELAERDPNNANVLYELARLHMDSSFQALSRLRKLDPDSFHMHLFLGWLYFEEQHFEAAIKEFQIALKMQPDALGVHFPLGTAYRRLHKLDMAKSELLLALQEAPDDPRTNLYLGDIAIMQQQYSDAIQYLNRTQAAQPEDPEAYILLGRCYLALEDPEQAKSVLLTAARLDPTDPRSHYLLAEIYRVTNQPAERQRELELFNKLTKAQKESASGIGEQKEPSPEASTE